MYAVVGGDGGVGGGGGVVSVDHGCALREGPRFFRVDGWLVDFRRK